MGYLLVTRIRPLFISTLAIFVIFVGSLEMRTLTQGALVFGSADESYGVTPVLIWMKTFDNSNWDEAHSVIKTFDGGYAIAGYMYSHDSGPTDFWLIKTDSIGNEEWNKTFGDWGFDRAYSVIQTSDRGYAIVGYFDPITIADFRDFWLVKTDSLGNMQWNKTFGGENFDKAYSIIQTSDGGYAIAGYTMSYGAGGEDFWLVKTDPFGNEEWSKTFGTENNEKAHSVIQTYDGGYALAGYIEGYGSSKTRETRFLLVKTDSSGNEKWKYAYGHGGEKAHSLIQTSDGGYILAGQLYTETEV